MSGAGRPRQAGERYANGKLRPERFPSPTLTAAQGAAVSRYRSDLLRAATATTGLKKAEASEAIAHAKAALNDRQCSIVHHVIEREQTIDHLADVVPNATVKGLTDLFKSACDALAIHYASEER